MLQPNTFLLTVHHKSCTFYPLKCSLIIRKKKKKEKKKNNNKWAVRVVLGLKCHITIHVHADNLQQPSTGIYR